MGESMRSPIVVRSFEPFVPLANVGESSYGCDSDGNYFQVGICNETVLCYSFNSVHWGQKPKVCAY